MTIIQRIGGVIVLGFIIFVVLNSLFNQREKNSEQDAKGYCFIGLLLATAIIMLIP
jgi:uncharacterized membrane protein SirB2